VRWVVKDLERDVAPALRIPPDVALNRVACGDEGVEVQYPRVHLVAEVAPAALRPFARQVAGRDSDLIRARGDRRVQLDPVGVSRDVVVREPYRIVEIAHALLLGETVLATALVVGELPLVGVAEARKVVRAIEERAVLGDVEIAGVVGEAAIVEGDVEVELRAFADPERLNELIDPRA